MNLFRLILIGIVMLSPAALSALVIDRAIVSSDSNPTYLEYWPLVAHAWNKMGIKPTLMLIASKDVIVDESLGDVIRFEPLEGISTALQAQIIRLLVPLYFNDDEVCLLSDMDMIPVDKDYFITSARPIADDHFLVYRIIPPLWQRVSICYNAAQVKTFKEIFKLNSPEQIPDTIRAWAALNWGWITDEKILFNALAQWPERKKRCKLLNHQNDRRLDKTMWQYDLATVAQHYYIDIHCPGPYSKRKQEIDTILRAAGLFD